MDLDQAAERLKKGGSGAALQKLTESGAGRALAQRFDGAAVERAARQGDADALAALMKSILSTPEGADFAAQVRRAVSESGK